MLEKLKHKKLRKKNALLFGSSVMIGVVILGLIASYILFDEYKEYKKVVKTDKSAGQITHYLNEDDNILQSFFYPHFSYDVLNTKIEEIVEQYKQDKDNNYIHHLDYQSSVIYDQYYNVRFQYRVLDKEEKEVKKTHAYINYDAKENCIMNVDQVFRLTYLPKIVDVVGQQVQRSITKEDLSSFSLQEKQVVFYIDGKEVVLPYEEYKSYIALRNTEIPSLAPLDMTIEKRKEIDPSKPMIAFSFDDGPNGVSTPRILDILKENDAKATFFMLGQNIEKHPDVVKRMVQEGHEPANHTVSHKNLAKLNADEIHEEIFRTQDLIFQTTGVESKWLRPPYGEISDLLRQITPIPLLLWSIDSLDWHSRNVEKIKEEVLPSIKDGSLVLMHDIYGTTAQALEEILPVLKEQGYQFVTVSELYTYRPDLKPVNAFS